MTTIGREEIAAMRWRVAECKRRWPGSWREMFCAAYPDFIENQLDSAARVADLCEQGFPDACHTCGSTALLSVSGEVHCTACGAECDDAQMNAGGLRHALQGAPDAK